MKFQSLYYNAMANVALKKNDFQTAFAYYDKALATKNCSVLVQVSYAYRLLRSDNLAKCNQILDAIDQNNLEGVEHLHYYATKGLSLWKSGNLKEAIKIYEDLHKREPGLLVYETLGYLYLCDKDYEKALQFNQEAMAFSTESDVVADNLAASYFYTGDFKNATKLYKSLIEKEVTFPEPYYFYALILNEREKYKAALKYLRRALDKKESPLSLLRKEHITHMIQEIENYLATTEIPIEV